MSPSIGLMLQTIAPSLVAAAPEAIGFSHGKYLWIFWIIFMLRFTRTAVNALVFFRIQDVCLPKNPIYTAHDVTVVLPTIITHNIQPCIRSILANEPYELLLVVPWKKFREANTLVTAMQLPKVRLLYVSEPAKRAQMVRGLDQVRTSVTVFADDDVQWAPNYLAYLLTAFEDPRVGAAGTNQRVIRNRPPSIFNLLGISYIERRNFNNFAVNQIDGSVSTLSGRTCAFRTSILQTPAFAASFLDERFFGGKIKIGDDKMLTRWVFSHGWKIRLVWTEQAVLYTTLDSGTAYLHQCVRWARSHWQGNLAVVTNLGSCHYLWRHHPWGLYAIYIGSLMTPALIVDGVLAWLLEQGLGETQVGEKSPLFILTAFWLFTFGQKTIKMWPHFRRHPEDVWAIPGLIAFSYLHGFINLFALFTMRSGCWGNRPT